MPPQPIRRRDLASARPVRARRGRSDPPVRRGRASLRPGRPRRGGGAYGDYVDLVETGTEALADLRWSYAATLDEDAAEEYEAGVQPRRQEAAPPLRERDRPALAGAAADDRGRTTGEREQAAESADERDEHRRRRAARRAERVGVSCASASRRALRLRARSGGRPRATSRPSGRSARSASPAGSTPPDSIPSMRPSFDQSAITACQHGVAAGADGVPATGERARGRAPREQGGSGAPFRHCPRDRLET